MNYPIMSHAHERRLNIVLAQYWNGLRLDDEFPKEDQIDPDRLIGIWERCFMVQMRDIEKVKHFNYSYFGAALSEAYIDGRLDPDNTHIAAPNASLIAEKYERVIAERGPVMEEDSYTDMRGRNVLYRQIFMPLSNGGDAIHAILGGCWFKLE